MTKTEEAGALLTQLRKSRGWSRTELSKRSDVSTAAITNYERGLRSNGETFRPNISKVMSIASQFGSADAVRLLEAYGVSQEAQQLQSRVASRSSQETTGPGLGATMEVVGTHGDILMLRNRDGETRFYREVSASFD